MGREYPEHPRPSCHALVRHGEKVLLVQRARPPLKGFWGLPGGGVELGETVDEALVREVLEETGLQVSVSQFLGFVDAIERDEARRVRWHYVIFYYEAHVIGGQLAPADDASQAAWMTVDEARQLPLTDAVEYCFERVR